MSAEAVSYKDKVWDEQTAAAISRARTERWALLAHLGSFPFDKIAWKRVRQLNLELFRLTNNPIYNPLNEFKELQQSKRRAAGRS